MPLGKTHEVLGLQGIQLLDALEGSFVYPTTSLMHLACVQDPSLGDDCLQLAYSWPSVCDPFMGSGKWMIFVLAGTPEGLRGILYVDGRFHCCGIVYFFDDGDWHRV